MQITSIISTEAVERAMEIARQNQILDRARGDQPMLCKMSFEQASSVCQISGQLTRAVYGAVGVQRYEAVAACK